MKLAHVMHAYIAMAAVGLALGASARPAAAQTPTQIPTPTTPTPPPTTPRPGPGDTVRAPQPNAQPASPPLAAPAAPTATVPASGANTRGDQPIGYVPEASPYRDIDIRQEFTPMVGWYAAKADPAGVAPRSGVQIGAHYEIHLGGPAFWAPTVSYVASKRTVIAPDQPVAKRIVDANQTEHLLLADIATFALSLTGTRSWHDLLPTVSGGLGLVSDLRSGTDEGGFGFGTRFAFNTGAGIRWVPGGRLQLRADVVDHLYSMKYPLTYYTRATDGSTVLDANTKRSFWTNNASLTFGISYLVVR